MAKPYDKKICAQAISPLTAVSPKYHILYADTATLVSNTPIFCGKYNNMPQEE